MMIDMNGPDIVSVKNVPAVVKNNERKIVCGDSGVESVEKKKSVDV